MDPLRLAVQRLCLDWQSLQASMQAMPLVPSPSLAPAGPEATSLPARSRSAGRRPVAVQMEGQPDSEEAPSGGSLRRPARTKLPGAELPKLLLEAISCLRAARLPLDRLSLALVPEQRGFHGSQHQWSVDEPERLRSFLRLYEFFQGPDHRTSVLHHVCCTGRPQRLHLQELPPERIPFPLLRELRRDHFHDYLALPLPAGGSHRVVLTLASRHRQGFRPDQLALLRRLLPSLRQLLRGTDHFGLGRWESRDPLTAVASRHRLLQELAARLPGGGPLGLLLLDLDEFGAYNRVFGSFAADDALVAVAGQLQGHWGARAETIARIGSDSFALLFEALDAEALAALAHQVQTSITALRLVHPPSRQPFLTSSLAGLSWPGLPIDTSGPERARTLLARAEALLETARQTPGPAIQCRAITAEEGLRV